MKRPELLLIREGSRIGGREKGQPWSAHPVLPELMECGFFSGQRFTFVGIYYSSKTDTSVIGYPKYLKSDIGSQELPAVLHHVGLICQLVERAQSQLDRSRFEEAYAFDAYHAQEHQQQVDRFQLASWLLQDYQNNGIYFSKKSELKRNGNGPIQWQQTISQGTPLLGRDVVYLDTFHRQNQQDYSQLLTQLHGFILRQCGLLMQGLGQYQELELPEAEDFDGSDLSQFTAYLADRLTVVFSEREVRLLKALWAWCGQSAFYRRQLGVTAFEQIWEYAAKAVFGNLTDTRSGPPHYILQNREYQAQGDFIPDILRVYQHPSADCRVIGILDAKYYCPQVNPDNGLLYGAPANGDIAKQIGYYRYTKTLYFQGDIRYTNAFLFPATDPEQEEMFQQLGYACPNRQHHREIDQLLGLDKNEVQQQLESRRERWEAEEGEACAEAWPEDRVLLFSVRPDLLYQWCLRGEKVTEEAFYHGFVEPFQAEQRKQAVRR
ncbi:LlaJI family restriction endonuclease [Aminipila butyrica]|uniref:LlaJI family restriction endonuclease n=1 Tax=Aminipila butyrica TaxID=433296 RepID=A0A858BZA6_9FIRM|nr:LlaJI family restriction endonuclease [Aminipila butyrica]QIB70054.1 LlaJI family restriction endonuclease [Aminipila butyrica]